jgi:hypothetical protein
VRGKGGNGRERTEFNGEGTAMTLRRDTSEWALMAVVLLSDCREQKVESVAADSESWLLVISCAVGD